MSGYSSLSPCFSLMRSKMAWLMYYVFGVIATVYFMSLSHQVTASSSHLSCVSVSVSMLFKLPFSVLWNSLLSFLSSLYCGSVSGRFCLGSLSTEI